MIVGIIITAIIISSIMLRNFPFTNGNLETYTVPLVTSNDVFWHTQQSKLVYDSEQTKFLPSWSTMGNERVLNFYPPLLYVFVASFSKFVDLPVYQISFILLCLITVLIPLYAFIIIRRYFNEGLAFIVLVLGTFVSTTFLFQLIVGFWADLFAFLFIPLTVFLLKDFCDTDNLMVVVLLAFLFSASFIGHTWEATYLLFFAGIILFLVLVGEIKKDSVFKLGLLFISMFGSVYLFVFKSAVSEIFTGVGVWFVLGRVQEIQSYFPIVRFPWYIVLISLLGLFLLLREKLTKEKLAVVLFGAAILFQGFSRYLGFSSNQPYRQLYQGMVFMLVPFAICTYAVFKSIKLKLVANIGLAIALIVFSGYMYNQTYGRLIDTKARAFADEIEFESLAWVEKNTPMDSKILVLYGFEHGFGRFVGREEYNADFGMGYAYNIQTICEGKIPETYGATILSWGYIPEKGYKIMHKNGSIEYKRNKFLDEQNNTYPIDYFDYVVFQHTGTQLDACMQFYLQEMAEEYELVWANEKMAIIKI